ncbi:MAG: AbrB/MazE/SpoVT family DNA-binding domain-containing protein [Candidatus Bathyarchaeota archaeon]|nr:AbrB/MazE/SpoVT family DNA-binding domain-containing protein [Candidatus Bathyarchaeota archaeon]
MEEVLVTRKGQITVPIHLRRKYGIKEGMKITVEDSGSSLVLKVIPRFQDLIGADAETEDLEQTLKKLDKMRSEDRY